MGLYDRELHLEKLKLSEIKEAKEDARYEGLQEGRKEGLQEGRKEGKREEKVAIAKSMLSDDMDINIILKHTGLTKEEINKLL